MIPIIGCNKIAVFGLGLTGMSVLRAAVRSLEDGLLSELYAWDDKPEVVERAKMTLTYENSKVFFTHFDNIPWDSVDTLVVSPGIPLFLSPHPIVIKAKQNGCLITTDVEIFYRAISGGILIGVTGSNGKSTTTKLVRDILVNAGIKAVFGGNIGVPLLDIEPNAEAYVIELSSFQLSLIHDCHLDYAILLNITPNHLNAHKDMQEYIKAKMRIFDLERRHNLVPTVCVMGVDSQITHELIREGITPISSRKTIKLGVYMDEGNVVAPEQNIIMDISGREVLLGKHNEENICAATAVALSMGLPPQIIRDTVMNFIPLDHRSEIVGRAGHITFINDSKSTTAEAVSNAIMAYRRHKIFLILGGREKTNNSIHSIESLLCLCEKIYLVGETSESFNNFLADKVPTQISYTLDKAIEHAYSDARLCSDESVVLLSPACTSWDQWKNFEERGNFFKKRASEIIDRHG